MFPLPYLNINCVGFIKEWEYFQPYLVFFCPSFDLTIMAANIRSLYNILFNPTPGTNKRDPVTFIGGIIV